jgi:hypothetical protein
MEAFLVLLISKTYRNFKKKLFEILLKLKKPPQKIYSIIEVIIKLF